MRIYIFDYVGNITGSWHNGGGVAVITDGDPEKVIREKLPDLNPDFSESEVTSYKVVDGEEGKLFLFPDQGCC